MGWGTGQMESIYQRFDEIFKLMGTCFNEMNFVLGWGLLQFELVKKKHSIDIYQILYQ